MFVHLLMRHCDDPRGHTGNHGRSGEWALDGALPQRRSQGCGVDRQGQDSLMALAGRGQSLEA